VRKKDREDKREGLWALPFCETSVQDWSFLQEESWRRAFAREAGEGVVSIRRTKLLQLRDMR